MTQGPPSPPAARLFRFLLLAVTLVLLVPVWAGIRIIQTGSVVLGFGLVAMGLVTFLLAIRFVRAEPGPTGDGSYDITEQHVDYAIWAGIGIPFIAVGLFVLFLLTSGSSGT